MEHSGSKGFTLIEISIVLVVIGLIIGGIMVGQDLVRAAELRSTISDVNRFSVAVNAFRSKYNCLPGDCRTATDFFGVNPNCATNDEGTGTQTCNGNGDGAITCGFCVGDITVANSLELFIVWQHLAFAGLIAGQYSSKANSSFGAPVLAPVFNTPTSIIKRGTSTSSSGYALLTEATADTPYSYGWVGTTTDRRASVLFGMGGYNVNGVRPLLPDLAVLTPTEALTIDQKVDDGLPGKGTVITGGPFGQPSTCVTGPYSSTAQYMTATATAACALLFTRAF